MIGFVARWWCARYQHEWFPGYGHREFIPTTQICLRCHDERTLLPWGQCLGGHPIAQHYDQDGQPFELPNCPRPM